MFHNIHATDGSLLMLTVNFGCVVTEVVSNFVDSDESPPAVDGLGGYVPVCMSEEY